MDIAICGNGRGIQNFKSFTRRSLQLKAPSVTRDVCKPVLVRKLFPAIGHTFPMAHYGNVVIEKNNAKPHASINDPDIPARIEESWMMIQKAQPGSSPD